MMNTYSVIVALAREGSAVMQMPDWSGAQPGLPLSIELDRSARPKPVRREEGPAGLQ